MFFKRKYYYGISLPTNTFSKLNTNCCDAKYRESEDGNSFLEWTGKGVDANLEACKEYIKFIELNELPMVVSDDNKFKTNKKFIRFMGESLEFQDVLEKTNGQGLFKDIPPKSIGGNFKDTFIPDFKKVMVDEANIENEISNTVLSEEFTTLEDYKAMKLLVPILKEYVKDRLNEDDYETNSGFFRKRFTEKDVDIKVISTEFGWKLKLWVPINVFGFPIRFLSNINNIFNKSLESYFLYTEQTLDHFRQDKDFFSYYNYKSGLIYDIYNGCFVNNNKLIKNFYLTHLQKEWKKQ